MKRASPRPSHRKTRMLLVMRMMGTGRNRIEPAFIEWVAASDAFHGEPHTAPGAMRLDRFHRVMRTRRVETADRSDQRTQRELVPTDQQFQDVAHVDATRCQRVARLARKLAGGAPAAGNFTATTTSTAGRSNCAARNDSRTR